MVRERIRKRLWVDLTSRKSWSEEIPAYDLDANIGGRYLNAKLFSERFPFSDFPSPAEYPIALAVGPLAGTLAPCSGWTSVSSLSLLSVPPGYAHVSIPGHWGAQLSFAGFDQCVIVGESELPVYIFIDGEKVKFEDARLLWGMNATDTTLFIREEKEDRNIEILCIGPAGEKRLSFANVVNRISWAGDHIGLGGIFGRKNLKAIAIHGGNTVLCDQPEMFIDLCLNLRNRIHRDRSFPRLKEDGTFFSLGENEGGLGIKNFNEVSSVELERTWKNLFSRNYVCGREGCFSCPIHCGRIARLGGDYFGGIHLEGAWSLGPRIGIYDWHGTLTLYRSCLMQGIDPSALGSILSWVMDASDKGGLSKADLEEIGLSWGDVEGSLRLIDGLISGEDVWEIFRNGSLRAAKELGRGFDLVAHSHGMDLPIRDPRSSTLYACSLAFFPTEWDYFQSLLPKSFNSSEIDSKLISDGNDLGEVIKMEELKVLADITSLCPLVVAHLHLVTAAQISKMTTALTGIDCSPSMLMEGVRKTIYLERTLHKQEIHEKDERGTIASRLFQGIPSDDRNLLLPEALGNDAFPSGAIVN